MYKARVKLPKEVDEESGYRRAEGENQQPCFEWVLHLVLNVLIATTCLLSFDFEGVTRDENGNLKSGVLIMLLGQILLRGTFFGLPLFLTIDT